MASRIFLCVALLLPLARSVAWGQAEQNRVSCIQAHLEELGYRLMAPDTSSVNLRAQRRIGGAAAAIMEASSLATRAATLGFVQPPVERRFDELAISNADGSGKERLRVDAALVVVDGSASARQWPRAQAVIEAVRITASCRARP